jgi:DNA-binding transcriptional regulator YhcF (GntR family)
LGRAVFVHIAERLAVLFQSHDALTLSQAAAALAANPHTLKRKFRELVQAGVITAHGKGRGVFYRKAV